MADAWLKIQPNSGKGNLQISVSSLTPHTGRIQRQTIIIANVINDTSKNIKLNINQAPKYPFIAFIKTITEITYIYQRVELKFKTNTQGLAIVVGSNTDNHKTKDFDGTNNLIPYNYKDDPGVNNEFETTLDFNVFANYTLDDRKIIVSVETSTGPQTSYEFIQKGIDVGIANMTIGTDFIIR